MSDENDNGKNKQPDYFVQLAQEGRNGKEHITDVGAVWNGKNGYITGPTIAGRIILQPRAAREALQRMRAEKRQTQGQEQSKEMQPEQ